MEYLEANGVGTRQLFAGNILRQPMIVDSDLMFRVGDSKLMNSSELTDEVYKKLANSEFIMNNTFWVGTFPALGEKEIRKIADTIKGFVAGKK